MEHILSKIEYKPEYSFETSMAHVGWEPYTAGMLRVVTEAPCTITGKVERQVGRWLVVEDVFNEAEVVRTAYQALYLFELHEFQEHFKYHGKIVFNPHEMNV